MARSSRVKAMVNPAGQKPRRSKLKLALIVITLCLLALCAVAYGGYSFVTAKFAAPGPQQDEQVFAVPRGAGVSSIAAKLEQDGLIDSASWFKAMVRLEGEDGGLKAGEFLIPPSASLREVYKTLTEGKAILYPFTAAEGLTSAQIVRMLSAMDTLTGEITEIPAEGTLLPETYLTPRGMSRADLVAKMQAAQTAFLDEAWEARADNLPIKTKQEALILASVVEKETGILGERHEVAGVFTNRLNRGMRLESDPTIIYGITQGEPLGRGIRRSEIDRRTDWNTYRIDGLPITPICNPGKEAILAVLNPAETDAIFFVADGTGGHAFASTLAGHNANVKKWRAIERARKAKAQ